VSHIPFEELCNVSFRRANTQTQPKNLKEHVLAMRASESVDNRPHHILFLT